VRLKFSEIPLVGISIRIPEFAKSWPPLIEVAFKERSVLVYHLTFAIRSANLINVTLVNPLVSWLELLFCGHTLA